MRFPSLPGPPADCRSGRPNHEKFWRWETDLARQQVKLSVHRFFSADPVLSGTGFSESAVFFSGSCAVAAWRKR